jgi:hypothetical protein
MVRLYPGSPPVREFHPPPKVTKATLPYCHRSNKEGIGFQVIGRLRSYKAPRAASIMRRISVAGSPL